jgi:hypothetical protein
MPDEKDPPTLVQFIDEDVPEQLLPHLDADGVLLLKKDAGAKAMEEALCAWAVFAPSVTFDPKKDRGPYWAIWFKGTRKPSTDELTTWLQWSEGGTAPINLNPPPVLGD